MIFSSTSFKSLAQLSIWIPNVFCANLNLKSQSNLKLLWFRNAIIYFVHMWLIAKQHVMSPSSSFVSSSWQKKWISATNYMFNFTLTHISNDIAYCFDDHLIEFWSTVNDLQALMPPSHLPYFLYPFHRGLLDTWQTATSEVFHDRHTSTTHTLCSHVTDTVINLPTEGHWTFTTSHSFVIMISNSLAIWFSACFIICNWPLFQTESHYIVHQISAKSWKFKCNSCDWQLKML